MKPTVDLGILRTVPLFSAIPDAQLEQLQRMCHRISAPAGTTLISAADPGHDAYIILSGTVKIHIDQPDGGDVVLAILGLSQIFGEMSLAHDNPRSASAGDS